MEQGVSFGDYRFEVQTGTLWTGSQEVRLTPKASAVLAMLVARAGQPVSKDDLGSRLNAACLRSKLVQKEEALALLERVFANGWGKRDWIEHDPDYDILRDDPRFKKLLARLK